MERLDNFSKILLATGQINFVANTLKSVINGYKTLPVTDFSKTAISDHEEKLAGVLGELTMTLQSLADYMNDGSMVCQIDERVSSAASEILFFDMDEVETDYSNGLDPVEN